jgi:lipid-binding SYLF domain-containing protein
LIRSGASRWLWSLLLGLLLSGGVLAVTDQEAKVSEVVSVLEAIDKIPEKRIPSELLADAEGIAIIPSVVKVGFVVGGRYGKGVVSLRKADGRWSNPVFLSVTGGSIGWQIGAQSTDVILVFKSKRSIDGIINGKFTLGLDAAVAAGPLGRNASASTDAQLKAEIYSYSRSRGLFAGFALDGAALQIQQEDNVNYYREFDLSAAQIFAGQNKTTPPSATELKQLLGEYTRH